MAKTSPGEGVYYVFLGAGAPEDQCLAASSPKNGPFNSCKKSPEISLRIHWMANDFTLNDLIIYSIFYICLCHGF